jgi:hypothetical protein
MALESRSGAACRLAEKGSILLAEGETQMAIPTKTMAVRLFEYGGPEKLVHGEYDLPPLGPRDVMVKNLAGSTATASPAVPPSRCRSSLAVRRQARWLRPDPR